MQELPASKGLSGIDELTRSVEGIASAVETHRVGSVGIVEGEDGDQSNSTEQRHREPHERSPDIDQSEKDEEEGVGVILPKFSRELEAMERLARVLWQ